MTCIPKQNKPRRQILVIATLMMGPILILGPSVVAADIVLNETGSTLLYPLFNRWIPAYAATKRGVTITSASTGSGEGIKAIIERRVQIGTSDAYMSDKEAAQNPQIVNIPLAISALTINYNISDLNGAALKLDGPILAGIYAGTIRQWNAAPIAALNPDLKLPQHEIIPVRRADSSGDTFVFTQFLDFSTQKWEDAIGYGTTVKWPSVPGELDGTGNVGVLQTITATPYSIAYIGISFRADVANAHLGTATLMNQAGKFVMPTAKTIAAAASVLDPRTPPDERLTLAFAPGESSYPLVNYEYAVVSTSQPDPTTAAAIRDFLLWTIAINGGNAPEYLDAVGFIPLPDFIRALSENQIDRIK
jgi:phosphate transport system substrate-binding protein